jgi:malate dehydrogenase (oxaloacetate-decarboxylating)
MQYAATYRIFNDDMQGTGAITLAAALSAVKVTSVRMREQKLVVFGAGTAGVGIADQIAGAMVRDGASREQAAAQVWLVDKPGLAGLRNRLICREGWAPTGVFCPMG